MKSPLIALFFLFSTAAFSQQPVSSKGKEIIFEDVAVVPMDSERLLEHQTVIAKDGKITQVMPYKKSKYSKDAIIINGKGKYLMPGLAEMHAHVPPIDDIEPMKEVLTLFAVNGITTIRGMLGHPRHLELREKIKSGEILGPHFYTTGPSFNGMSVTSPEAGSEMVRKQKAAGYDYLKLHPGLSRAKFDSIAATAKKVGIPFAGHVSFGVGVWRAIEAGYSSIDHMDGFIEALVPGIDQMAEQQTGPFALFIADKADTTRIPQLINALRDGHIWVVPTQSLAERWFSADYTSEDFRNDPAMKYMKKSTVDQWINSKNSLINNPAFNVAQAKYFVNLRRKLIRECQSKNVGLLLGSDAPQIFNVPGFSAHNELQYLVASGLSPYEALKTGTVSVATYLQQKDSGIVRKGAISDLVLLDRNPLEDIKNTMSIAGVLLGTTWMDREYIQHTLKKLEKN